ncbi:MATE family efflux transporter [Rhodococcus sp. 06-1059B-a]|nr:MATE family efflux transporter [Rhodococcus sp. 06-1059B-a]OZD69875.1 MATE family efflux transporter [Rhodococcus sp. 06-1059B-a]
MNTSTASTENVTETEGSNRWYLSSAPIFRALVHLCIPMAAALIVTAVYNVVNAGFIGSLHDATLLAAVTLGSPVLGIVMAVGGVFGTGGSALISRLLGGSEADPSKAGEIKHVASFSVWGAAAVGGVIAAAGVVFVDPLVAMLGAQSNEVHATTAFVVVLLVFVPVLTTSFCLEQLVRAEGATRQVMTGLILSTVANVVFDVLFILVLHFGVAGAALSVGLANVVTAVYFVTWLSRHSEHVSLAPRHVRLTRSITGPVFGIGVGELTQAGFLVVTSLVLNNLAAAYGDGPLAAMGVAVRIAQVPEFLIMGVTLGCLPLLAYAYGKGDARRLYASVRGAGVAVGVIALVFSAAAFVFREQVFAAFVADTSLLALGGVVITAQLVSMIFNGAAGLVTTLFQATGRVLPATIMSMTQGLAFVPIVVLGNLWFGLNGIIWALTVSEGLVLVAGVALWLASRTAIARGLDEGDAEPADAVLGAGQGEMG